MSMTHHHVKINTLLFHCSCFHIFCLQLDGSVITKNRDAVKEFTKNSSMNSLLFLLYYVFKLILQCLRKYLILLTSNRIYDRNKLRYLISSFKENIFLCILLFSPSPYIRQQTQTFLREDRKYNTYHKSKPIAQNIYLIILGKKNQRKHTLWMHV